MSTSSKLKETKKLDSLMEDAMALRNRSRSTTEAAKETTPEAAAQKFANIQENTFYKIMFSEADPEEKKNQLAAALTYDATQSKADNRTRLEEFATFKEYVHYERKQMAQDIIRLTDTETFGTLKDVFEQMNMSLLDFENEITPLMEILDAVYEINKAGGDAVTDVFREIEEERRREEELTEKQTRQQEELTKIEQDVRSLRLKNAQLGEQKSFFGFGGITREAREQIAANELALQTKAEDLTQLKDNIRVTAEEKAQISGPSEYAEQKAQIKKLLDITSDEHRERSERLVQKAQDYIDTTYDNTTNVLDGLRDLSKQIDNLGNAHGGMTEVFAVINDGMRDAEKKNEALRDSYKQAPEGVEESSIEQMKRDRNRIAVEEYIGLTMLQSADNIKTTESLAKEGVQIMSLRETNNQQIVSTQTLASSGVSGIASQLATVLQGVSAASLDQSRETSQNNIDKMNRMNEGYLKKQVMSQAMGVYKTNDELVKTIERLRETGEFIRNVNEAVGTGVRDMRQNLNEMERVAKSVQDTVDESVSVHADTIREDLDGTAKKKPANDLGEKDEPKKVSGSPFSKFSPN